MGKFLSFGSLKQPQEMEENEYIEDNELHYIQDNKIPQIPSCPNKGDNFGHNNKAELSETFECDICKNTFYSKETYGVHIKKNYVFCTACSHLFLNEKELKKHKTKCNICEVCSQESHKGVCKIKNSKSNKEKKRK